MKNATETVILNALTAKATGGLYVPTVMAIKESSVRTAMGGGQ